MDRYQGTFKRYEIKYLISEKQYLMLAERLEGSMVMDEYGVTSVNSIYYDTIDWRLVRNSLEKPVYKEKLRLRSYGTPAKGDEVYIELKKKYQGVVYKRREKLELKEAELFLQDFIPVRKPTQITSEIDHFIKFYGRLLPSMYISYDRIALYSDKSPGLRVTFDNNILWRQDELHLEYGVRGMPLLKEGQRLMEVKVPGSMPLWLVHQLDELKIFPVSFSKYGNGYLQSQYGSVAIVPQLFILSQTEQKQKRKGEIVYA